MVLGVEHVGAEAVAIAPVVAGRFGLVAANGGVELDVQPVREAHRGAAEQARGDDEVRAHLTGIAHPKNRPGQAARHGDDAHWRSQPLVTLDEAVSPLHCDDPHIATTHEPDGEREAAPHEAAHRARGMPERPRAVGRGTDLVQVEARVAAEEAEPVVRLRPVPGRYDGMYLLTLLEQLPRERRHVVDVRIGAEHEHVAHVATSSRAAGIAAHSDSRSPTSWSGSMFAPSLSASSGFG